MRCFESSIQALVRAIHMRVESYCVSGQCLLLCVVHWNGLCATSQRKKSADDDESVTDTRTSFRAPRQYTACKLMQNTEDTQNSAWLGGSQLTPPHACDAIILGHSDRSRPSPQKEIPIVPSRWIEGAAHCILPCGLFGWRVLHGDEHHSDVYQPKVKSSLSKQ